jgi:hypothetical protein
MKRKLLFVLMLASVTATNAFALKIVDVKLLQHREWSTGGRMNMTHQEIKIDQNAIQQALQKSKIASHYQTTTQYVSLSTKLGDVDIQPNALFMNGKSEATIANFSQAPKNYTVTRFICYSQGNIESSVCSYTSELLEVPGGDSIWVNNQSIGSQIMSPRVGEYRVGTGIDVIAGDNGDVLFESYDERVITVPATASVFKQKA